MDKKILKKIKTLMKEIPDQELIKCAELLLMAKIASGSDEFTVDLPNTIFENVDLGAYKVTVQKYE